MTHQVVLNFEDGVSRFITCSPGETVADASYQARINIPLDCRDGACGTCKSWCESGEYDGGDYIDEALTDDEAAQGYALPCQMMPRSDLVLQIPTTSAAAKAEAGSHTATLTEIQRFSDTTVGFTLEVDDRDALAFLPGQYVNISVPGQEATRSYSFSSAQSEKHVSFLVRITEGGAMSNYLSQRATVGDRIEFTGPRGSFFLRDIKRPALLLAGGTGLAPILSMVGSLVDKGIDHPVHLIYGVTTDADLVEVDRLRQLAESLPGFSFDYCVADQASTAPNKGYVTGLFTPENVHDGEVDVYLCGPPAMVEAVRRHMDSEGIAAANFYFEKFAVAAGGDTGGDL
jgi:benzoate/toluate 1,2-dioxygenase reductase subunit